MNNNNNKSRLQPINDTGMIQDEFTGLIYEPTKTIIQTEIKDHKNVIKQIQRIKIKILSKQF